MKRIQLTFILTIISYLLSAQAPNTFRIQLLVKDNLNNTLMNRSVGIRLSILKGSETGGVIYSESLTKKTNDFGLLTIDAGYQNPSKFAQIIWKEDNYFTKIDIDITGGTNYTLSGISQLLEVPFAEYAKSSDKAIEDDPEFIKWNKSTGIKIIENQIKDLIHFKNINETDQVFKSSLAATIKENDLQVWNENDPIFSISAAKGVNQTDTAKWNKKSIFNGSFNSLTDKPTFSASSISGNYADLKNKPTNPVSTVIDVNNGILQFNGNNWISTPNGVTGQRLGVDASGVPAWKDYIEIFNNVDRPFYEYNQENDYYYCLPWNYEKTYNSAKKYPLVIYLHPSGAAGSIRNLGLYYLGYDTNDGIDDPRAKNFQTTYPSFIVVPQAIVDWDYAKIISIIEDYKSKYRIDDTRIYVIGYSLGGAGSYSLANAYYDFNKQLFAGIIRLSGQSQSIVRNEIANKTAIWLQIGLDDFELRVTVTREAYNFLKNYHTTATETSNAISVSGRSGTTFTLTRNNKEIVKKTEYVNVGHEIGTFPFEDVNLIKWLFSQKIE